MANRSIRDARGGVPLMQRPINLPPAMQQPAAGQSPAVGNFAQRPADLPRPQPMLGQQPVPVGGRPGELPSPQTRVTPPLMPPAPMPGATGPGTASPGMAQGGGIPMNPQMRR